MSSIILENVCRYYGSVKAVADLSLSIPEGKFVTFLGPSGSGKTTTMRMIAGLERATDGRIFIGGDVVSDGKHTVPTHKRNLGMVFQSYAVWPHMTVAENVAFPLRQRMNLSRSEEKQRVNTMLALVDLANYDDRYPSQLSGGQQQRVALARALVSEPAVVLFDEPLSNLDAKLRVSMRTLLADIHKKLGTTSVFVTHDQEEAMVLSDEVHVMGNGRLLQSGTPEQLYLRPNSRFVAQFFGSANTLTLRGIQGNTATLSNGAAIQVSQNVNPREMLLVTRPHQLSFAKQGAQENVLQCKILGSSYMGDRRRYSLQFGADEVLSMDVAPGSCTADIGEEVGVYFPPADCLVI